jgi:hypothetical protein
MTEGYQAVTQGSGIRLIPEPRLNAGSAARRGDAGQNEIKNSAILCRRGAMHVPAHIPEGQWQRALRTSIGRRNGRDPCETQRQSLTQFAAQDFAEKVARQIVCSRFNNPRSLMRG